TPSAIPGKHPARVALRRATAGHWPVPPMRQIRPAAAADPVRIGAATPTGTTPPGARLSVPRPTPASSPARPRDVPPARGTDPRRPPAPRPPCPTPQAATKAPRTPQEPAAARDGPEAHPDAPG